jgi:hypothetical protein
MGVQSSNLSASRKHMHSSSTTDLQSSLEKKDLTKSSRPSRSCSYPTFLGIYPTDEPITADTKAAPVTGALSSMTKTSSSSSSSEISSSCVSETVQTQHNTSIDSSCSDSYLYSSCSDSSSLNNAANSPSFSSVSSVSSSTSSSYMKCSCANCARTFTASVLNDFNESFCSGDCYWSYMFTIHDHNSDCECFGPYGENQCDCYERYLSACHDNSIYYDDEYVRYRHERAKLTNTSSTTSTPSLSIAGDSNAKAIPMPTISVVHHPSTALPPYASGACQRNAYPNQPTAILQPYYHPTTRIRA